MRRKATVILLVSSIAFLVAMIIFFTSIEETKPGSGDKILGETEVELFKTYTDGEEILNYIDLAATYSLGKANKAQGSLAEDFRAEFGKYLNSLNSQFKIDPPLDIKKYVLMDKGGAIVGMYDGKVTIKKQEKGITYSFMPNFKVEKGLCFNSTGVEIFKGTGAGFSIPPQPEPLPGATPPLGLAPPQTQESAPDGGLEPLSPIKG